MSRRFWRIGECAHITARAIAAKAGDDLKGIMRRNERRRDSKSRMSWAA
jgi:hypothetical protein